MRFGIGELDQVVGRAELNYLLEPQLEGLLVALVAGVGGQQREIQVDVDPYALRVHDVRLAEVERAVATVQEGKAKLQELKDWVEPHQDAAAMRHHVQRVAAQIQQHLEQLFRVEVASETLQLAPAAAGQQFGDGPGDVSAEPLADTVRQAMEEAALDGPTVTHPGPGPAERAGEGHLRGPGIVLGLQVRERGERAQGPEARLEIADGALHLALRGRRPCRPAGSQRRS